MKLKLHYRNVYKKGREKVHYGNPRRNKTHADRMCRTEWKRIGVEAFYWNMSDHDTVVFFEPKP